ncbi:MAG: hypothetical protein PHY82_09720 [Lentisphaeria bacterium]|nr:hypothetical protein [Lentisphaeria bacterium]
MSFDGVAIEISTKHFVDIKIKSNIHKVFCGLQNIHKPLGKKHCDLDVQQNHCSRATVRPTGWKQKDIQ